MTGNRILYGYALFFSFILFVLFDLYLFHLLLVFLLILPPVSLLTALPARRKLRYALQIDDDIVPKGACGVTITARNGSLFPCTGVRFVLERHNVLGRVGSRYMESALDVVQFPLGARRSYSFQPAIKAAHCGRMDLTVVRASVIDMMGLFALPVPSKNAVQASGSIYVLPELQIRSIATEDAADLGLDSAAYSTEKAGGDPSEIFQLRDYREGDARHSVHWKLSSRMNRLIVREFGLPLNPSLLFLLELREGAEPSASEAMLGAMLAYSEYLMARDVTHSVSWLGDEGGLHTVPVTGPEALASVLHELLALPGQKRWSALENYAVHAPKADTHLVYMIAGTVWTASENESAARLTGSLIDLGICHKITVMPERCSRDEAAALREMGCEVQLLDGSVPELGTEAQS